MGRFPRIADMEIPKDEFGRSLCRECAELVPKGRRAYCSNGCMHKFTRDHTWSLVRDDVLRLHRFKCQICDKRYRKSLLEVDHIIPIHMGGQLFDKDNLRPLCKECHRAKTRLDREAQR